MAKKRAPRKSRIRKSSTAVSNAQRSNEMSKEERATKLKEMFDGQDFVHKWNTEYVGKLGMDEKDLTEYFNNIQLQNNHIIVHTFLENPMKHIVKDDDGEILHMDYYIRQIDYRERNTDKATWGPTPFPIINKGIIMAMAPFATLQYHETKQKLALLDPALADKMIIPKVGDTIYLNHFTYKEARYYVDKQKQCEDFVKNQREVRMNNFDFLFKIGPYEIESVVPAEYTDKLFDVSKIVE